MCLDYVRLGGLYELVVCLAPNDRAALAVDRLGHRLLLSIDLRIVDASTCRHLAETLSETQIQLCGQLLVRVEGQTSRIGCPAGRGVSSSPISARTDCVYRTFFPGGDGAWVDETRSELDDVRLRAHECVAASGLGLGGAELDSAKRSGRALVKLAPHRESGYRLLMETLAAEGNAAEALDVYETLRLLMQDELGVAPSPVTRELHRRLLG